MGRKIEKLVKNPRFSRGMRPTNHIPPLHAKSRPRDIRWMNRKPLSQSYIERHQANAKSLGINSKISRKNPTTSMEGRGSEAYRGLSATLRRLRSSAVDAEADAELVAPATSTTVTTPSEIANGSDNRDSNVSVNVSANESVGAGASGGADIEFASIAPTTAVASMSTETVLAPSLCTLTHHASTSRERRHSSSSESDAPPLLQTSPLPDRVRLPSAMVREREDSNRAAVSSRSGPLMPEIGKCMQIASMSVRMYNKFTSTSASVCE